MKYESKYFSCQKFNLHYLEFFQANKASGPPILYFHGTGFNAGMYQSFYHKLSSRHQIYGLDFRGHGKSEPCIQLNSPMDFLEDLHCFFQHLQIKQAISCGHSLGAIMSLLHAWQYPEKYYALIIIDPPTLPSKWRFWVSLARFLKILPYFPLPAGARRRRYYWNNQKEIFSSYRTKKLFALWEKTYLQDYIEHGTIKRAHGEGYRLACHPLLESTIFGLPYPDNLNIMEQLKVPTLLIRGENSRAMPKSLRPTIKKLVKKNPYIHYTEVNHSTHFPIQENQKETLKKISDFIDQIDQQEFTRGKR